MINRLIIGFFGVLIHASLIAQTHMPIDTIEVYFNRVKQICDKDNGNLWGKNLYAPILVIDRQTREVIANSPDNENILKKEGNVYVGAFPENLIISNSTTTFGGKLWTMVAYPFEKSDVKINRLFTHELFHQFQKLNGLDKYYYDNSHMDNLYARIYLKFEWNALLTAINSNDNNINAISDALLFRTYRRSLFPVIDSMENKFEIQEGLADYTSFTLCSNPTELLKNINDNKELFWNSASYVRSFGYFSGLLYGYLLDKYKIDWRKTLKYNDDLGAILQIALNISLPNNFEEIINSARNKYGYDTIYAFELARKQEIEKKLTEYRTKFTINSTLTINLIKPHFGFDPKSLQPLDSLGTVFPFVELVDDWGKLKVTDGGCLISSEWNVAVISTIDLKENGNEITAKGWSIKLNENWEIIKNDNKYLIRKKN